MMTFDALQSFVVFQSFAAGNYKFEKDFEAIIVSEKNDLQQHFVGTKFYCTSEWTLFYVCNANFVTTQAGVLFIDGLQIMMGYTQNTIVIDVENQKAILVSKMTGVKNIGLDEKVDFYLGEVQSNQDDLAQQTLLHECKLPGYSNDFRYQPELAEKWRSLIRNDKNGELYLNIYSDFVDVWVNNSERGVDKLEELCDENHVTVEDFVRCLSQASKTVLLGVDHWLLRGYYTEQQTNTIETKLLSSWTTDYETARGFAHYRSDRVPHVFATKLGAVSVLSHHIFCEVLDYGINNQAEYEVIVVNEKCFSRDNAQLQAVSVLGLVLLGGGAEASVYGHDKSDKVIVHTTEQSKRDMLDMFIQHPHRNLPQVYKLSDNVYVMERLFGVRSDLVDANELVRLSKTYQPIGTLNFKGIIDNSIFSALTHLKAVVGERRYRVDFWGYDGQLSNIMQRANGELVLVDPITTLKMTQEEWEASR